MKGLKKLRLKQGRKQCDVAEESGISPGHLSEIERGVGDPSMQVLERILAALGATLTADANVAEMVDSKTKSVRRYKLK